MLFSGEVVALRDRIKGPTWAFFKNAVGGVTFFLVLV